MTNQRNTFHARRPSALLLAITLTTGCQFRDELQPSQDWINQHANTYICSSWWPLSRLSVEPDMDSSLTEDTADSADDRELVWLAEGVLTYQPENQLDALSGLYLQFELGGVSSRVVPIVFPAFALTLAGCHDKGENCGGIGDDDRPSEGTWRFDFASSDGHPVADEDLPFTDMYMTVIGDQLQVDYLDRVASPGSVTYSVGDLVIK